MRSPRRSRNSPTVTKPSGSAADGRSHAIVSRPSRSQASVNGTVDAARCALWAEFDGKRHRVGDQPCIYSGIVARRAT